MGLSYFHFITQTLSPSDKGSPRVRLRGKQVEVEVDSEKGGEWMTELEGGQQDPAPLCPASEWWYAVVTEASRDRQACNDKDRGAQGSSTQLEESLRP